MSHETPMAIWQSEVRDDPPSTSVLGILDGNVVHGHFELSRKQDVENLKSLMATFNEDGTDNRLPANVLSLPLECVKEIVIPRDETISMRSAVDIRGTVDGKSVTLSYIVNSDEEGTDIIDRLSSLLKVRRTTRPKTTSEAVFGDFVVACCVMFIGGIWSLFFMGVSSGWYDNFEGRRAWMLPLFFYLVDKAGVGLLVAIPIAIVAALILKMIYSLVNREQISVIAVSGMSARYG